MGYSHKFEVFEGKMHDNSMAISEMKAIIKEKQNADKEAAAGNEKGFELLVRETKLQIMKKLDAFIKQTNENFDKNDPAVLEKKMVSRMNDAVTILTREMADKADTKKNFKLLDRMLKNVYTIAMYGLKQTSAIPPNIIKESHNFKLFQQIELITNFLMQEQSQATTTDDNNEYVVIGDEMGLTQRGGVSPTNKRNYSLAMTEASDSLDKRKICQKRQSQDNLNVTSVMPNKPVELQR